MKTAPKITHPGPLVIRPYHEKDVMFYEILYYNARPDIQLITGSDEFRNSIAQEQWKMFQTGVEKNYPNALRFIAEEHKTPIGGFTVDFRHNEVRLIFLGVIPEARHRGLGTQLLQSVLSAASKNSSQVTVVAWKSNLRACQFYSSFGFQVLEQDHLTQLMTWFPPTTKVIL
jgi:ribosomal protein S18 acetylase RimI-like enzyme